MRPPGQSPSCNGQINRSTSFLSSCHFHISGSIIYLQFYYFLVLNGTIFFTKIIEMKFSVTILIIECKTTIFMRNVTRCILAHCYRQLVLVCVCVAYDSK